MSTIKQRQKEAEEAAKKALDFSGDKYPPKDLDRIRMHYKNGYIYARKHAAPTQDKE
jgi:hypothetical protein